MKKFTIIVFVCHVVGFSAAGVYYLVTKPSEGEKKALYQAIRKGDLAGISKAVEENPRLVNTAYKDRTPLESACGIFSPVPNRNAIVKFLLENGADPNVNGWSCLRGALYSNDGECVKLLLEHGADPMIVSPKGETALDYAKKRCAKGIPEIIERHLADEKSGG